LRNTWPSIVALSLALCEIRLTFRDPDLFSRGIEALLRLNRAIYRERLKTPHTFQSAIEDYDRTLEFCEEPSTRLKTLNYRAMLHARLGNIDKALADWQVVIDRRAEAPRQAAQACLNAGGRLRDLGRLPEAQEQILGNTEVVCHSKLDWLR
jgi:tetratricopeptide (TPR) repeat protein